MGAKENEALVRRGYEAFMAGDMDTLGTLFTDDAAWHVGGNGALSGDKQGKDAIFSYFGELFSRSDGTLRLTLEDVLAGEDYAVGVQSNHAKRNGRELDQQIVVLFSLRDGKVADGREFSEDTAANADFWS